MGWVGLQLSKTGWKLWGGSKEWNGSRSSKSRKALFVHQNENRYFPFLFLSTLVGMPFRWLLWGSPPAMLLHHHPCSPSSATSIPGQKRMKKGLLSAPALGTGDQTESEAVAPSFWWVQTVLCFFEGQNPESADTVLATAGSPYSRGGWSCRDLQTEDFGGETAVKQAAANIQLHCKGWDRLEALGRAGCFLCLRTGCTTSAAPTSHQGWAVLWEGLCVRGRILC